ncbi:ATP-dependent helicase HrpB [Scenedesmus sp. NREL 46B-D3]|nr:ATP-dependent helicase HrpB [Scenedesmus sp. NREL 46B-D3]
MTLCKPWTSTAAWCCRYACGRQAPPGAGKTTAVPLALLLHQPQYLRQGQRIVVLEPRRVAAKAAARRMAALLGEPVGRSVGYRVKLESRVSSATRIEVVTEGILLRRLQQDPSLEGVGALLLDEFHERGLDADTSLALALDCQAWARPDLSAVLMSSQKRGELERAAADAVLKALASPAAAAGDVLCFMPGLAEIRRLQQLLQQDSAIRKAGIAVQQLHGGLSPQQQDEVIRPNRSRQHRRVVIATPIAESSITIDGVTAVVDSGLARAPCYSPATGISRLLTQRISQDSAEQRRGRAGRTQPGVCYRLWGADDHEQLLPCSLPEIASADLAPLALQLASWGSPDGKGLAWLDPPEPQALADARQLLLELAAVDEKGSLTATGRRMAALPAHPRFAHVVLRAQQLGVVELGCLLAALLKPAPAGFDQVGASRVLLGRVVTLPSAGDPLAGQQYIAAAELQAGRDGRNDRVVLGASLTQAAIQAYLRDEIQERLLVFWASASKQVVAKQQRVLGSLVLSEQAAKADDERALPVLLKALATGGYSSLPVPAAAEAWRARAAWLHAAETAATGSSSVPDLSAAALMGDLGSWLLPHLAGCRSRAQLQKLPWLDIFKGQMDWATQQHVDEAAPSHLQLPTGSTAALDYCGAQPTAAVKMQEVLGLADTPLLGGHACVALVLELLSPAGRPLQVTANLASFWAESYQAVKKEMKGRYPKHIWPDDPANTAPTKLTKKQMAAAGAESSSNSGSKASSHSAGGKAPSLTVLNKKSRR